MSPHVVADIGNTRIKWGLCGLAVPVIAQSVSLPPDPAAWEAQLHTWQQHTHLGLLRGPATWVLASVQPRHGDALHDWLMSRGQKVLRLQKAAQLPLTVDLEFPDRVGIDRLLDALAARSRLTLGQGAVLIDVGSAVTVDWLDERHHFRGGAIYPGIRLMAEALHQYTALLPLVSLAPPVPSYPGNSTTAAMQVGILAAVMGAIRVLVERVSSTVNRPPALFFTGGDSALLIQEMGLEDPARLAPPWQEVVHWPDQTLAGILHAAEGVT